MNFGPFLGMAQKEDPSYLRPEILQYAMDVDFSRGTIAPMRTDRIVETTTSVIRTLFLENCCLKKFPKCGNIAFDELGCGRVFTDGVYDYPTQGKPDQFCSDTSIKLGWPCITIPPEVEFINHKCTDRKAEERTYVYTFTNIFGEESPPSPPSTMSLADHDVSAIVSGFQDIPAEYGPKFLNLYQLIPGVENGAQATAADSDQFFLVAVMPHDRLAYKHNPLVDVPDSALTTDEYAPVPEDAHDIQHWGTKQIAFISSGNIRFTEPWNYSVSPEKYTYQPRHPALRFLAGQAYGYILNCGQPEVIDLKLDPSQVGIHNSFVLDELYPIIGRKSPAMQDGAVIYASTEGLVMINGRQATVLSVDIFTREQWDSLQPHTMIGTVYNGYYYGATDVATFRLAIPSTGKSGYAEKFSYLSIKPTAWYLTHDNRLLYADDIGIWELGQGDDFKVYKATTKTIVLPRAGVMSAFRLHAKCGKVTIRQHVSGRKCHEHTTDISTSAVSVYRLPRVRGSHFSYDIEGVAEVSNFYVNDSVREINRQG